MASSKLIKGVYWIKNDTYPGGGPAKPGGGGKGMPGGKPGGRKPGGGPGIPGGAKGIGGRANEGGPTITNYQIMAYQKRQRSYWEASFPYRVQQAYHVQDQQVATIRRPQFKAFIVYPGNVPRSSYPHPPLGVGPRR